MRHGEPAMTGRLLGRTDAPATAVGIEACRRAAAGLMVEAIVSSDLVRAAACAGAIAAPLGLSPRYDPRWRELDFGTWDGMAPGGIDPDALARFHADPDAAPPPEGERWSALTARVADALAAIDRPALVVTHAGAMRAALAATCGFDVHQAWAFALPYAACLSLTLWPGTPPMAQITGLASPGFAA
ncbi:histidine phosphatase family protein [Sphingomonas solaris]